MSKTPKPKVGRPATGRDKVVSIRLPQSIVDAVDANARTTERPAAEVYREAMTIGLQRLNAPTRRVKTPEEKAVDKAEMERLTKETAALMNAAIERRADALIRQRATPRPIPNRVTSADLNAFVAETRAIKIGNKTVGQIADEQAKPKRRKA